MIRLEVNVFAALSLSGVILVEADPQTVAQRVDERDQAHELHTTLILLVSTSPEEFAASVNQLGE